MPEPLFLSDGPSAVTIDLAADRHELALGCGACAAPLQVAVDLAGIESARRYVHQHAHCRPAAPLRRAAQARAVAGAPVRIPAARRG